MPFSDMGAGVAVPDIGAKVSLNTGMGVLAGNLTHVNWDTLEWDNGDLWNPAVPAIFSISTAGLYFINAAAAIDIVGSADIQYLGIWKNNAQTLAMQSVNGGIDTTFVNLSAMAYLSVGDFIALKVFLTVNASTVIPIGVSDWAVIKPYMSIQLIRAS